MKDAKPSDIYVGVIDLFSILLPGTSLLAYIWAKGLLQELLKGFAHLQQIQLPADSFAQWFAFILASYAVGHFVFLIASFLDRLYDFTMKITKWLNPKHKDSAHDKAEELMLSSLKTTKEDTPMNVFSWAKSILAQNAPIALAEVNRYEADSKFFRSLVVVLAFIAAIELENAPKLVFYSSIILALLSYWRYSERRHKSTEWSFRHVITFCAGQEHKLAK